MKNSDNRGFALLETIIVSVFIISIFTFVYISVVPLIGKYEELTNSHSIEVAYKLYHIRDAIYKDDNFKNIVNNDYHEIKINDFQDRNYYQSLMTSLFENDNFRIIFIRKLKERADSAINTLKIEGEFATYIHKIANTKASVNYENFIFLNDNNQYAYLGLGTNLNDLIDFKEPEIIDPNNHVDKSGANNPKLADGMIPIYYSDLDKKWKKADYLNKSVFNTWYDYDKLQWANIALVKESKRSFYQNASLGEILNIDDIIAFYVWIPRYEYLIDGKYGLGGISKELPGEISVNFIKSDIPKVKNKEGKIWRTPTAFSFGKDELDGFWFAKFESSNSSLNGFLYNKNAVPFIVPEAISWINELKISDFYNIIMTYMNGVNGKKIYGLDSSRYKCDTHIMKNDEWGAVAYLSQSKYGKYGNKTYSKENKEIYMNNRQVGSSVITGSSSGFPPNSSNDCNPVTQNCSSTNVAKASCYKYFVLGNGTGASTTGTIYGIYDMSGGVSEFVMGGLRAKTDNCGSGLRVGGYDPFTGFKGGYGVGGDYKCNSNGITFPQDNKYYNSYARSFKYGCDTDDWEDDNDICFSHAMSETDRWYGGVSSVITEVFPWYIRGGRIETTSSIFTIVQYGTIMNNLKNSNVTTRPTIAIY